MSAVLEGVVSTELAEGAVSVLFVEADVWEDVDPEVDADGGVDVGNEELDVDAVVETEAEVDVDVGVGVMVKWMLFACCIICFNWMRP